MRGVLVDRAHVVNDVAFEHGGRLSEPRRDVEWKLVYQTLSSGDEQPDGVVRHARRVAMGAAPLTLQVWTALAILILCLQRASCINSEEGFLMAHLGADLGTEIPARRAPRFVDVALLERVSHELRAIERQNGIERTLAIGCLILTEFFDGNPESWRDRRRGKHHSIRRLAERSDCPYSKSSLNEALAVYVASLELPCVRTFGHVGTSHIASVLTLPIAERQTMLEKAERERLSVRELREQVVGVRRSAGERRGRPTLGDFARAVSAIESEVRRVLAAVVRLEELGLADPGAQAHLATLSTELLRAGTVLAALARGPTELRRASEPRLRERTG